MRCIERVVSLLAEQNMMQKTLAKDCGIPPSTINAWIKRNSDFPCNYVMPIAAALGVSPVYLLTGSDEEKPLRLSDDEKYLLELFRSLDTEGRSMVTSAAISEQRRLQAKRQQDLA